MKKMLCLVFSLMMLLTGSALAEEEKEITFQGVPWGSSVVDSYKILFEKGLFSKAYDAYSRNKIIKLDPKWLQVDHGRTVRYLTAEDGVVIAYASEDYKQALAHLGTNHQSGYSANGIGGKGVDAKIAGYQVKQFDLWYAYHGNNTELVSVVLMLIVDDVDEAYSDLTAKLTTLYGEPESHSSTQNSSTTTLLNTELVSIDYPSDAITSLLSENTVSEDTIPSDMSVNTVSSFYIPTFSSEAITMLNTSTINLSEKPANAWLGANNTAVVLVQDSSATTISFGSESNSIVLIYGTLDAQEILDAYYAEYQENYVPEPTVNPFDLSGL